MGEKFKSNELRYLSGNLMSNEMKMEIASRCLVGAFDLDLNLH